MGDKSIICYKQAPDTFTPKKDVACEEPRSRSSENCNKEVEAADTKEKTNRTGTKCIMDEVIDVDAMEKKNISDCSGEGDLNDTRSTPVAQWFYNVLHIGPYTVEKIRFPYGKEGYIEFKYKFI